MYSSQDSIWDRRVHSRAELEPIVVPWRSARLQEKESEGDSDDKSQIPGDECKTAELDHPPPHQAEISDLRPEAVSSDAAYVDALLASINQNPTLWAQFAAEAFVNNLNHRRPGCKCTDWWIHAWEAGRKLCRECWPIFERKYVARTSGFPVDHSGQNTHSEAG